MEGSQDLRLPCDVEIVDYALSTGWPALLASTLRRREISRAAREISLALS